MTPALVISRWLPEAERRRNWPSEAKAVREAVAAIRGATIVELNAGAGLIALPDGSVRDVDAGKRALSKALPDWDVSEQTSSTLPAVSR